MISEFSAEESHCVRHCVEYPVSGDEVLVGKVGHGGTHMAAERPEESPCDLQPVVRVSKMTFGDPEDLSHGGYAPTR